MIQHRHAPEGWSLQTCDSATELPLLLDTGALEVQHRIGWEMRFAAHERRYLLICGPASVLPSASDCLRDLTGWEWSPGLAYPLASS